MEDVTINLGKKGHGNFCILEGDEQIAEMEVSVSENDLTVYHTEVSPKAEGKGLAKKLLNTMADHARKNGLQVFALCPFVYAQFKRHPEEYADLWNKDQEQKND